HPARAAPHGGPGTGHPPAVRRRGPLRAAPGQLAHPQRGHQLHHRGAVHPCLRHRPGGGPRLRVRPDRPVAVEVGRGSPTADTGPERSEETPEENTVANETTSLEWTAADDDVDPDDLGTDQAEASTTEGPANALSTDLEAEAAPEGDDPEAPADVEA